MGAPAAGASYGYLVGGVFIFNLIVGTGALALPYGYSLAGVVVSGVITGVVALLAYIGVTFIVECISHATLLQRTEKAKDKGHLESAPINAPDVYGEGYGAAGEGAAPALLDDHVEYGMEHFELGTLSDKFLGKFGRYSFYAILLLYLYGDLAIYAVAVPQSLNKTFVTSDDGVEILGVTFPQFVTYWFFLFAYAVFALPFCFFNFTNTKYLQMFTIGYRNLAFWTMIILALIWIGEGHTKWHDVDLVRMKGLPELWGTVIYCFMCHHSVPGLISPLHDKKKVHWLMGGVYLVLFVFYSLLSMTAMFAYDQYDDKCEGDDGSYPCALDTLYTYNFLHYSQRFVSYYLTLFPVFTITTNYPLIAITLRNNMLHIFPWGVGSSWERYRPAVFSALASIPSFLLAIVFVQVDILVSLTGAYAGLGIEFVIPAVLIYYSRQKIKSLYPKESGSMNPYASPFQHPVFIWIILGVAVLTLVVVTVNNVVAFVNWVEGL